MTHDLLRERNDLISKCRKSTAGLWVNELKELINDYKRDIRNMTGSGSDFEAIIIETYKKIKSKLENESKKINELF